MDTLSKGFCSGLLTASFSDAAMDEYKQQWPRPVLQIVDLQRFPIEPDESHPEEPSRFYAVLSDAESALWLVVPPETEMEEMIASYQIDIGCCIALDAYTFVPAPNGFNVLIPLSVSFSLNALSLLGQPTIDPVLFPLSARALPRRMPQSAPTASDSGLGPADVPIGERIVLRDLVERPETALRPWSIVLRIVFSGHAHPVHGKYFRSERGGGGGVGGGQQPQTRRVVQRCVGVDAMGDAVLCVFWRNLAERTAVGPSQVEESEQHPPCTEDGLAQGDCLLLHRGTISWGTGEGVLHELAFADRSIVRVCAPADVLGAVPSLPRALLGALGTHLQRIADVLTGAALDETVTVVGVVRHTDNAVSVHTKRGRLMRVVVTMADEDDPGACVDVTFWGEQAEQLRMPAGEVWFVSQCTVREFMGKKTLSARSSSIRFPMQPASADRDAAATGAAAASGCSEGEVGDGLHESRGCSQTVGAPRGGEEAPAAPDREHGVDEAAMKPTVQLVLGLSDASQTLPVLARIQRVEVPLTREQCTACRALVEQPPRASATVGETSVPSRCCRCGTSGVRRVFYFTAVLSDGLTCEEVTCIDSVGAALTNMPAEAFAHATENDPHFERTTIEGWVGTPVLAWLVRSPATPHRTLITCKYVNMRLGAEVLLSTIDSILA